MTAQICVLQDKLKFSKILKNQGRLYLGDVDRILQAHFCKLKSLKGAEQFNQKGRGDPLTGEQVLRLVGGDFRNTYCLMGMITINVEKERPMVYSIGT